MPTQTKVSVTFKAIKLVLYIFCLVIFILSLIELILVFKEGATSQSQGVKEHGQLQKPAVTICPQEPFKSNQLVFETDQELFQETYSKEEIFAEATLKEILDTSKYIFRTVRSEMYGLCYTLQPKGNIELFFKLIFNSYARWYFF